MSVQQLSQGLEGARMKMNWTSDESFKMFQVPKGVQLLAKAVLNAAYLVLGYVGCSLAWSTPSYMRAFAT